MQVVFNRPDDEDNRRCFKEKYARKRKRLHEIAMELKWSIVASTAQRYSNTKNSVGILLLMGLARERNDMVLVAVVQDLAHAVKRRRPTRMQVKAALREKRDMTGE